MGRYYDQPKKMESIMLNKVLLIGNVGGDVDSKTLPTGTNVANFTVATSKKWKKDGIDQEKTEWHRIVAWGKLAEICSSYVAKGRKVYVEGELETRTWENKDGVKMYTTEVIAKEIKFLSNNKEINAALSSVDVSSSNVSTDVSFASEDIPF